MTKPKMTVDEMKKFIGDYTKELAESRAVNRWGSVREIIKKYSEKCRTWKHQAIQLGVDIPPVLFHYFSFKQRLIYALKHTEEVLSEEYDISCGFRRHVLLFASVDVISLNPLFSKTLTPVDQKWLKTCSEIFENHK